LYWSGHNHYVGGTGPICASTFCPNEIRCDAKEKILEMKQTDTTQSRCHTRNGP
jgi:hypothetical protein